MSLAREIVRAVNKDIANLSFVELVAVVEGMLPSLPPVSVTSEELRKIGASVEGILPLSAKTIHAAADTIDAQQAEIARLRGLLDDCHSAAQQIMDDGDIDIVEDIIDLASEAGPTQ